MMKLKEATLKNIGILNALFVIRDIQENRVSKPHKYKKYSYIDIQNRAAMALRYAK